MDHEQSHVGHPQQESHHAEERAHAMTMDATATANANGSSASSSETHGKPAMHDLEKEELPNYSNGSEGSSNGVLHSKAKEAGGSIKGQRFDEDAIHHEAPAFHTMQHQNGDNDDLTTESSYGPAKSRNRFSQTFSTMTQRFKSKTSMARTLTASSMGRVRLPSAPKPVQSGWQSFADLCSRELNFYRIHLLFFTFTPLIFAAIFYASNTTPIPFIDCLFVCVSAMTVTGLVTYNISISTNWQQAMLFFLMCIGNISAVSITMILIRRHFFRLKFDDVIRSNAKARQKMKDVELAHQTEKRKQLIHLQRAIGLRKKQHKHHDGQDATSHSANGTPMSPLSSASTDEIAAAELQAERELAKKREKARKKGNGRRLRADMIRRMDQPAVLINPTGAISHKVPEREAVEGMAASSAGEEREKGLSEEPVMSPSVPPGGGILTSSNDADFSQQVSNDIPSVRIEEPVTSTSQMRGARSDSPEVIDEEDEEDAIHARKTSRGHTRRHSLPVQHNSPDDEDPLQHFRQHLGEHDAVPGGRRQDMFPRAQTIEFSEPPRPHHADGFARSTAVGHSPAAAATTFGAEPSMRHRGAPIHGTSTFERTPTIATMRSQTRRASGVPMTRTQTASKRSGFGGFPTPIEIAGGALKRFLPHVQERLQRSTTLARTSTYASGVSGAQSMDGESVRYAPYLSFDVFVSRNSRFHELSEAQRDELGGVEYRAIDLLAKLLPAYILGILLFCIVLVAPWAASKSAGSLHSVIASQAPNDPNPGWAWAFNVVSAYSNTGMSLIDSSMTELATQYFMLIPLAFLILAGNTGFPIFLRFFIWCFSMVTPRKSRTYETLRFLLDHPRRCFVYLFPSAQTWFLLMVLIVLNCTDWIFFEVLDLGNKTIESWGVGQRIFDGLFQSIAVRAAGFQIISLLQVAPALQFLYIVMMYISAYPIAMSVRNTNVYEEKSLGIYNMDDEPMAEEPEGNNSARVWGKYLAAHARRQLAFDMWWLGFALWLICIIERAQITDPSTDNYFTVFTCLFELTSAYGTVGLSTGTPTDDFSLSGKFRTLSKLVVIAVMLRGRHRGLPVAIDRAVMLPDELAIEDDINDGRIVLDENGNGQPRSLSTGFEDEGADAEQTRANTGQNATAGYFPRSNTNVSFGPSRGLTRYLSRDKTPPTQYELDNAMNSRGGVMEADIDEQKSEGSHSGSVRSATQPQYTHQFGNARPPAARHLTAITEATYSPGDTPTPNEQMSRNESAHGTTNGILDGAAPVKSPSHLGNGHNVDAGTSQSSLSGGSSSNGSRKGKEREQQQHDSELKPTDSTTQQSALQDEEEQRLAERYGCPT